LLLELETVELCDLPRIETQGRRRVQGLALTVDRQKCTTILPILLLDSDNPLLVDQPEDNLDNRFIFEAVVDSVRSQDPATTDLRDPQSQHPVLGDAERGSCLIPTGECAQRRPRARSTSASGRW